MNIESSTHSPGAAPVATAPASKPTRTNKQIKVSALADGLAVRAKWKTLIAQAKATWPEVHAEELATVRGNFHALAGLVQLRHRLSREAADQQVRAFFDQHDSLA